MVTTILFGVLASQALTGAHSHNDYERPRPLFDALDHGFDSVEADLFLVEGKLLVGHNRKDLTPERSFEALYLQPLAKRLKANGGWVYRGEHHTVWVLVDIKADGAAVYAEFKRVLAQFPSLSNRSHPAVRFIISGDRPIADIVKDKGRYAALDGRWNDLKGTYSRDLMPWVSEAWDDHFKWNGDGEMPADQAAELKAMAQSVHAQHRMLRFWGAADGPTMWSAQRAAGIDWLNTDHPAELQAWLTKK